MDNSVVSCLEEKVDYLNGRVKFLEKKLSAGRGFYCNCWYCEEHRISGTPVGCKVEDKNGCEEVY